METRIFEQKKLENIFELVDRAFVPEKIKLIASKVLQSKRINENEAMDLYKSADLSLLGMLANYVRVKKNGLNTYFNRNIHIEPTNICIYNCKFCSYSRKKGEPGYWEWSINEIKEKVENYKNGKITEVHIVGGTHPDRGLDYYTALIEQVKKILPHVQIKAFTAVELDYMFQKSGVDIEYGLKKLKAKGLVSLPGGGAEIFHKEIRKKICPKKIDGEKWLKIHKIAHNLGIPTNATMLYGHIERYEHRVDHLARLRKLQDETNGFQAFIPLKFRSKNNLMSKLGEVSIIEDFKNYAISRIFLDNFRHLKAYWPMLGKENVKLALSFGVDDIDGTIDDTTQIYTMAGAEEAKPVMSVNELVNIIKDAGYQAVERDTLYNQLT